MSFVSVPRSILPAILLFASLPAWPAETVLAVRSSNLPLYEQATKSFRGCVRQATVLESQFPDDPSLIPAWAEKIQQEKPSVILTLGSSSTRAVRERLKNIPTVFSVVLDPTFNGFNPPGVTMDLKAAAQVEFIHKYFPQFKRIGIIVNPERNKALTSEFRALHANGQAQIIISEVKSVEQMQGAISNLSDKADCLLMLADPVLYSPQAASQIILQTLQLKIPLIGISPAYVKAGALAGIYSTPEEVGCLAGGLTDRMLKGEKTDAIMSPSQAKWSINLIVAERLQIKVDPALVQGADQVFK